MENVYEQFFALMYHGNWDFQQSYNLPVGLREWFVKRLIKQKEEEAETTSTDRSGKTFAIGPNTAPPKV